MLRDCPFTQWFDMQIISIKINENIRNKRKCAKHTIRYTDKITYILASICHRVLKMYQTAAKTNDKLLLFSDST